MNDWKHTAQSLWEAVHARVKELKAEGETLQAIADIDSVDLAAGQGFHVHLSPKIKAVGVVDAQDFVVVDVRINRPVVAENASVVTGAVDVVNPVSADFQGDILRRHIDRPRIHQEIHRSLFPICFGLIYLIVFHNAGRGALHCLRKVKSRLDGDGPEINKSVPGDPVFRPGTVDAGTVREG